MRQEYQYKCTCDCCHNIIESKNDENDVNLNSLKYIFCPKCYGEICSLVETMVN